MFRWGSIFSLFVLLYISFSSLALAAPPVYRVGYTDVPTFFHRDETGHYSGKVYDYLETLAIYANCRFEYVAGEVLENEDKLRRGDIDILANAFSRSGERMDFLYSSLPCSDSGLYLSGQMHAGLPNVGDDLKIGYYPSDISAEKAMQLLKIARVLDGVAYEILPFSGREVPLDVLSSKRANYIITTEFYQNKSTEPITGLGQLSAHLAVRQDNPALYTLLENASATMYVELPKFRDRMNTKYHRHGRKLLLTQEERSYLAAKKKLIVYVPIGQPPFSSIDKFGNHVGILPDILKQMSSDLDIPIEIKETTDSLPKIAHDLNAGTADIMADFISDFSIAHDANVRLTEPILEMEFEVVTRKEYKIPSHGATAAVVRGYNYQENYCKKKYPNATIHYYNTRLECLKAVNDGKVDFTYFKTLTVQSLIYANGLYRLKIPSEQLSKREISMATAADNVILTQILNKEIAHLDQDDIAETIARHAADVQDEYTVENVLYRKPAETIAMVCGIFIIIILLVFLWMRSRTENLRAVYQLAYHDATTGEKNLRWFQENLEKIAQHNSIALLEGELFVMSIGIQRMNLYRETFETGLFARAFSKETKEVIARNQNVIAYANSSDLPRHVILYRDTGGDPIAMAAHLLEDMRYIPIGQVMTKFDYYVGIAKVPPVFKQDYPQILANSETALHVAAERKKEFCLYDDKLHTQLAMQKRMEDLVPQALRCEEFEVWYQPKYDLKTKALIGAEALVRWNSPELGFLMPGQFIDIFEHTSLIVQLDYYMLNHVCEFQRRRLDRDLPIVPISVNQSGLHITENGYLHRMKDLAEKYRLPPKCIDLEITETAFIDFSTKDARSNAQHIIESLKSYGYALSMDDFCTGYSSISMLQNLPMDVMKIDRSMLLTADKDARAESILGSMVKLGHSLDMLVLCEGIETEEQEELLLRNGCRYGQGYLFSKPLPQDKFILKLEEDAMKDVE